MSKMNGFENFIIICYYNLAIFPLGNKAQWFGLTFEMRILLKDIFILFHFCTCIQKAKDLLLISAR